VTSAREFYNRIDPVRWGREELPDARALAERWRMDEGVDAEAVVLELGCGRGAVAGAGGRYHGLDLSLPALTEVPAQFGRICADMEVLPVKAGSIDYIFSFAALEHVPHPERVLAEIERVLRPRGVALLAPAWHCRPWAAEGLEFRGYAELTASQRFRKRLIPLRNALLWRAAFEAPRRAARELRMLRGRPMTFDYHRLEPNLDEYVGTDCDAFTSMDPHAAILYFASRGWEVLSHPGRRARLLSRAEAVVVRKPSRL
jgi:SAM-dependent methyltransferase